MAESHYFEAHSIAVSYGNTVAVDQVSLSVVRGGALAIAGSNGAGKSSLLTALAGLISHAGGVTNLGGVPLARGIASRVQAGLRLVPEHGKVYPLMSVQENLLVSNRYPGSVRLDDAFAWFPRLAQRRSTLAGNLSGGEQQMLAIAMAVLGTPRVLLLDEPTLGLSVPVIHELAERLGVLRQSLQLTIIMAESDAKWLPLFTDQVVVLDRGALVARFPNYDGNTLRAVENYMVGLETI